MKTMFRERNSFTTGMIFLIWVAAMVLAAFNVEAIANLQGRKYHAIVAEAGGLKGGDAVRVNGVKVGRVTDVRLADKGVEVTFTVTNDDVELRDQSSAAIKVATVLGDKELALTSAGEDDLSAGSTIPLERTHAPYDVSAALSDLTSEVGALDTGKVAEALDVVSATLAGSPKDLGGALRGVERLSRTLNARDQEILDLASHARTFSAVLSDRSVQMKRLVEDGNVLFAELEQRQQAIGDLLHSIRPFAQELGGLVRDNEAQFGPALDRLNRVIRVLRQNRGNLAHALSNLSDYATGLGEAVGSGRFFTATIENLLPGNLVPTSPGNLFELLNGSLGRPATNTTKVTR
jgi:phospholipid/cholesterol/gamma-HCH transport system substrate-binding protein